MKPLGLGEHGEVTFGVEHGHPVALTYVRDFSGRRRRLKRSGVSRTDARRRLLIAVEEALAMGGDGEFPKRSTLAVGAAGFLVMFEGLVVRGRRSPSTLDLYRDAIDRHIVPGVGSLRLGEVSTARLDRFIQSVLADRGYATAKLVRTVLSGICGWLVRRDGLAVNPVRDATPLEVDLDRTARAMTPAEVRRWLGGTG